MTKCEHLFVMNHLIPCYGAIYGSIHGLILIASVIKVSVGFNLDGQLGGYDIKYIATVQLYKFRVINVSPISV